MIKNIHKKQLILLFALLVSFTVSAATYSYTFPAQVYNAYNTQSLGGVDWTASAMGYSTLFFAFDAAGAKGQQFGSSFDVLTVPTVVSLSTTGISGTISSVLIRTAASNPSGTTLNATVSISVGGVAFTSNGNAAVSMTGNNVNLTFTGLASGEIVISWSQPETKRALFIKTIEVTYDVASGIEKVENILSVTALNGKITFDAMQGDKVQIYNTLGKNIFTTTAINGKNSLLLKQRGLFLVKVGNSVSKVIL